MGPVIIDNNFDLKKKAQSKMKEKQQLGLQKASE